MKTLVGLFKFCTNKIKIKPTRIISWKEPVRGREAVGDLVQDKGILRRKHLQKYQSWNRGYAEKYRCYIHNLFFQLLKVKFKKNWDIKKMYLLLM